MSDDLVKRLRCYADLNDAVFHPWVYGEAADRIEKLEAALDDMSQYVSRADWHYLKPETIAALEAES